MIKFTLKQILIFSALVWSAFIGITLYVPPEEVFHFINPISMALAVVVIMVYGRGALDAFRSQDGVTLPHLLTFGVVLNWTGLIIRMARWYLTGSHPSVSFDLEFWFYNLGLWISIWAGLFLLGAAGLTGREYKTGTLTVIFLLIFGFLTWLGFADLVVIQKALGY